MFCSSLLGPACEHFELSPNGYSDVSESVVVERTCCHGDAAMHKAPRRASSQIRTVAHPIAQKKISRAHKIYTYDPQTAGGLPSSYTSPYRSTTDDDDDEDDEPTLLCISSTQWLMVCLNTVDGSSSYTTLLLVCAAVQYSRSQVQQLLNHMTLEEVTWCRQTWRTRAGWGVYVCVWVCFGLGVCAVVRMTMTT